MHIGIDCRLPTYRMGGISQYTIHLIQALSRLAGDERFTIFHSRREARSFLPPGDGRFDRRDLWTPCHHRFERQALAVELWPHQLDVVHSPDFIPPAAGAKRRVITVHDLTFLLYPEFLTAESRRYYSDQIRWAVAAADHILADSEATRRDLLAMLDVAPSKVTTVHLAANPVHTAHYPAETVARTAAEYGVGRGFILFVGTLEPRKNLVMLLHAYRKLRDSGAADVPLVLAGGRGWIYEEIFRTIEGLLLTEHVIHLEAVPDEKLAHLYRAAGVLAMPSHYEGFGLPALEAMHGGCPVVASTRGSLPEVVGQAAISLEPDDEAAWVDALARVLTTPSLAEQMRAAGLAQAARFTWESTAAATLAVYRAVGAAI
ncbi:MAG: glycosyltransferase family 4 protein [Candidatus Promineofilum sp.]|nr:glycosyltransferase family 4 protein [Promineifilum sp.]